MSVGYRVVEEAQLRAFTEQVFRAMGCSGDDAVLAADVLLSADLRGIDSHGVARLPGYVRLWQRQRINAKPHITTAWETPTTATVDGDAGLGLVVAPRAMDLAIAKARQYGSGWVAIRNSNHFGIAAYHALKAMGEDMIGFAVTNASPLVAPTFSRERLLGTNPICYAFPAGDYPPLVVDMATSAAANGKLEIAERASKPVPEGWVLSQQGEPATDPGTLKAGGMLLPLGSDYTHGSHKGYGLSSIVDILSGVLSGANYGPWVPPFVAFLDPAPNPPGAGLGHFVGAMRVDGFRPAEEFKTHIDNWITRFKKAERIDKNQPVIIPGEPEHEAALKRKREGIPLVVPVWEALEALGSELAVTLPPTTR